MIFNLGLLGYALVNQCVALRMHAHGWLILRSHILIRILQPRDPAKLSTLLPSTLVQRPLNATICTEWFVSTSFKSNSHFVYFHFCRFILVLLFFAQYPPPYLPINKHKRKYG